MYYEICSEYIHCKNEQNHYYLYCNNSIESISNVLVGEPVVESHSVRWNNYLNSAYRLQDTQGRVHPLSHNNKFGARIVTFLLFFFLNKKLLRPFFLARKVSHTAGLPLVYTGPNRRDRFIIWKGRISGLCAGRRVHNRERLSLRRNGRWRFMGISGVILHGR